MNNQLKNDHYVYILVDAENTVRYIGHGRQQRFKRTQGRSEDYMEVVNNGGTFEFPLTNTSKEEAIRFVEKCMRDSSVDSRACSFVNKIKLRGKSCMDIIYDEISKYVYYDETSPTLLRWSDDAVALGFSKHASAVRYGNQAGWPATDKNYGGVQFNGKTFHVHRVIWSLHNKKDVPWNLIVNHIDSNITNNSPNNIEIGSYSINSKKKSKQHNNSTGVVGVSYCNVNGNYVAHIYIDGKRYDKNFSSTKYGDGVALQLATEWRVSMEETHYKDKYLTHRTELYLKE